MSYIKHITPGPWQAIKGAEEGDELRCAVVAKRHPYDFLVATIENGAPGDCCDTEWANAQLFAEAGAVAHETGLSPRELADQRAELLAALEGIVHAVCGPTGFANAVRAASGSAYHWPTLDYSEGFARAAIAKAKGEAP